VTALVTMLVLECQSCYHGEMSRKTADINGGGLFVKWFI